LFPVPKPSRVSSVIKRVLSSKVLVQQTPSCLIPFAKRALESSGFPWQQLQAIPCIVVLGTSPKNPPLGQEINSQNC